MRALRPATGLLFTVLVLTACDDDSDPTGPGTGEEIRRIGEVGLIVGGPPPDALTAPAAVAPGEDFEVRIWTQGNGCVRRADEEVELVERQVTIRVFDFERVGVACTEQLKRIPHDVHLRFDTPGPVQVVAVGGLGDSQGSYELIVLRTTVTVGS